MQLGDKSWVEWSLFLVAETPKLFSRDSKKYMSYGNHAASIDFYTNLNSEVKKAQFKVFELAAWPGLPLVEVLSPPSN